MGPCWLITLRKLIETEQGWVNVTNIQTAMRGEIWTPLLKEIRGPWPETQAWSVLEWGEKATGVHLHGVVRGPVGITSAWLDETVRGIRLDYTAHLEPIKDQIITEGPHTGEEVVVYLTKQLRMQDILEGWPPYTHVVARTGSWLPREADAAA